ncbi:uncharacterized protein LOC101237974 isoform X1 [Hydra vulgaris]|uniref:uncharacterized protein LOC101237974 isoform X1 n=1 Tax=Hydra vulgaris TaxID=6087 RepID=UPI001F5E7D06|nr:uncharacterized protein LOC101237974 [Hydra vulgaris]
MIFVSCVILALASFNGLNSQSVKGGWAAWSEWSGWGKGLCEGNQRVKTRACSNPVPSTNSDDLYCIGDNYIKEVGEIDGGLSEWSQWSSCEKPCGGSVVNRTRQCDSPSPSKGGLFCAGEMFQTKLECVAPCPEGRTDGAWSPWSEWTSCPESCSTSGGALVHRYRSCNMPPPMYGGALCAGNASESVISCFDSCPIHGGFGSWSSFSECSQTCGSGTMHRSRTCSSPEPRGIGAKNCTGVYDEVRHCRLAECVDSINGAWAQWSAWTTCSEKVFCQQGVSKRERTCSNPAPNKGGDECPGIKEESQQCPTDKCQSPSKQKIDFLPVANNEYLFKECGATKKYATQGQGFQVPDKVLAHTKFNEKFKNGYYATQVEEGGQVLKYCFEPWPLLTIKEAADLVPSYRKTPELPNYKRPDERVPVLGFSVRIEKDTYKLRGWEFGIERTSEYIAGNKLKLHDVMFTYYSDGTFWSLLAKGNFLLFSPTVFKCVIFNNGTSEITTSMLGKADSITLQSFLNVLNIPDEIAGHGASIIKAFKNIGIWETEFIQPQIGYDFVSHFTAPFRITVSKKFNGVPLHFEIVYIHSGWDKKVAFGFSFDGESYGSVLEKMADSSSAGKAVSSFMNSIGLQIEVGLGYCPVKYGDFRTTKATGFIKSPLNKVYSGFIPGGLTAVAMVSLPKDCLDSSFCKICKKILGSKVNFRIMTNVKAGYLKAAAGFYDIKIYDNYQFSKLELFAEVNTTSKQQTLGFKAEVRIPINVGEIVVDGMVMERSLTLGGQIKHKVGSEDISGSLYMSGMWYHAFGLDWLNIGNINLGLTITIGSPIPVTGFQFGGQLEFGTNCLYHADFDEAGHCLRIQIYFGYGKPTYFYGKISSLTIGKLVRMCGGRATLPDIVNVAGFPKGLMVSYNAGKDAVDLRFVNGPVIPDGFQLQGVLNLFGYSISAHIKYSSREIYIDGDLDPINLGGFVIMSRNESHLNVGPKLHFAYKSSLAASDPNDSKKPLWKKALNMPYWKIYFEGFVNILGIKASAFLNVSTTELEMYIYGKVLNLIYAELYVATAYDYLKITEMHFYIRAIVDLRGLTDAIERARKAVNDAFIYAQKKLLSAVEDVKAAKIKCKEKLKIDCANCYALKCREAQNNCKNFLDSAGKWIGGQFNKFGQWVASTARKIGDGMANIGRKIASFFGRRRRSSLLAQRDEQFDIHIRNKRFVSKILCEGLVGGGCKAVSHLCHGTCSAVDFIGQGLCNVLDVATAALKATEVAMGWVNSAIQFVMQMFLVHGIRFELGLGQKLNGFMVGAAIDLTIFGQRQYFEFQFDLKNPVQSIMNAKDGGLYRYKEGVRQLRTAPTFSPYDRPNPFSDFDISGTFGIESLRTRSESRLGACIAAPTTDVNEEMVLIACNNTDERQRWTHTLHGMLINLYSKKCLALPDMVDGKLFQSDCDSQKHKHLMNIECDLKTKTLKLRKKDLCVTTVITSEIGPGSIQHHGSLKCIHISPGNKLVLRNGCQQTSTEFEMNQNGHLYFRFNGWCVRVSNGIAISGASLELIQPSLGCDSFSFTKQGSLQHISSRLCVQTLQMEMIPRDYTELVLGKQCEYVNSLKDSALLPDLQMTFTFIPQNNKLFMMECGELWNMKFEQRFGIMHDEINTVCSKHWPDLALNKIAVQSSTNRNGFADRAVDGDFNFQWEKGSCTLTNEEVDPWWRVDLGNEYIVTDVTIVNRGDRGDYLTNFQVHVGSNLVVRQNPVCHDIVRYAGDAEAIRLQCNPPIPGKYVGLQMFGTGVLSVCEVIVASRLGSLSDYCQIENGGCDQICHNECGSRKTTCSCRPGFKLAYDGKSCFDIDECLINNGGCRTDQHAYCKNTPGSFHCLCFKGFIHKDNSLTECTDINECGSGNGGCEQMCNNTLGGYLCTCRKGYERKKNDMYGCQNINECLINNGGCEHNCNDFDGGHYCYCRPGFNLMEDGVSCEEVTCSTLEVPQWGIVSPSICTKRFENLFVGTVCSFQCAKGYEIKHDLNATSLLCRTDGTWNSSMPSCYPEKCPSLVRPENGGLIPSRCHSSGNGYNEFGQRCVAYCDHGYQLQGPATKYCLSGSAWSSEDVVKCIKVIDIPYLNCPNDFSLTLPPDKNTVSLGSDWVEPNTNINFTRISVQPVGVGRSYQFRAGQTVVSYSSMHDSGSLFSCSYVVHVKDISPPVLLSCPSDIVIVSSSPRETISWTPPTFTDNVGVTDIILPRWKPGNVWESGEYRKLHYDAYDAAGNKQTCSFTVTFKSLDCPTLYGDNSTVITTFVPQKRYSIVCLHQKTLFGNFGYDGSIVYCKDGDYWIDSVKIGLSIPECVSYTKSSLNQICDVGSEKLLYENFFGETIYYCAVCPRGSAYNSSSKKCELCPVGSYQDQYGKVECETCPRGSTTKQIGARFEKECLTQCKPGYYSSSGIDEDNESCVACSVGSFSDIYGATSCQVCPDGGVTLMSGANDKNLCTKPIKITQVLPGLTVASSEGSSITLKCYYEGYPLPAVFWSKSSGIISESRKEFDIYNLDVEKIGVSLTLYDIKYSDAGKYKCTAKNEMGGSEVTVDVFITPSKK